MTYTHFISLKFISKSYHLQGNTGSPHPVLQHVVLRPLLSPHQSTFDRCNTSCKFEPLVFSFWLQDPILKLKSMAVLIFTWAAVKWLQSQGLCRTHCYGESHFIIDSMMYESHIMIKFMLSCWFFGMQIPFLLTNELKTEWTSYLRCNLCDGNFWLLTRQDPVNI